ncbi:hypothetical protein [Luoshenia tenuis]|nr:hypothetical protein [Luoshenia tenuis]
MKYLEDWCGSAEQERGEDINAIMDDLEHGHFPVPCARGVYDE